MTANTFEIVEAPEQSNPSAAVMNKYKDNQHVGLIPPKK